MYSTDQGSQHADTPLPEPFLPLDLIVPCLLIHRNLHEYLVNCKTLTVQDKFWFISNVKKLEHFRIQKNWYIIPCLICMHICWNCIFKSQQAYILGRVHKVTDTFEQSGTHLIACPISERDLLRVMNIVMVAQIHACFLKKPWK